MGLFLMASFRALARADGRTRRLRALFLAALLAKDDPLAERLAGLLAGRRPPGRDFLLFFAIRMPPF
ncbi:MAG: hypothetical protein GY805_09315 [Chloroflexi bacterium]|nr:hypothetical protein [Chloroflexota bacterium]